MAVTGHKSMSSVAPYTKRADQARLAREAFETQIRAEREQKSTQKQTQVYPKRKSGEGSARYFGGGVPGRIRTCDLRIRNPLLLSS